MPNDQPDRHDEKLREAAEAKRRRETPEQRERREKQALRWDLREAAESAPDPHRPEQVGALLGRWRERHGGPDIAPVPDRCAVCGGLERFTPSGHSLGVVHDAEGHRQKRAEPTPARHASTEDDDLTIHRRKRKAGDWKLLAGGDT